jgi:sialate O-acetylesterase
MKRAPMLRRLGLFALGLSAALLAGGDRPARADVTLPNLFGSHMVLQQKRKDRVWGWANLGEGVTVTIGDQSQTAQADKDGK